MGFTVLIGVGSFSRMAEATLSWLLPWNARWPVSISYSTAPSEKRSLRPSSSFPLICSVFRFCGCVQFHLDAGLTTGSEIDTREQVRLWFLAGARVESRDF